jgi:hypothetical protein
MKPELRYVWDITTEKDFSKRELQLMQEVSQMIVRGCNVKDIKDKLKQLKS